MSKLRKEIEYAINCNSAENGSNTPDFILAEYLTDCLSAHDKAVTAREKWYGREPILVEARDIIRQLLIAVPTGHCTDFHHSKKDQHGWDEPCPVEKRWRATTKRAEDFISSANTQPTKPQ